jgi:nitrate/nitrite-specific signal transduction histidine kinase
MTYTWQEGTWPVRKEDFASKYQKEFSAFVNAIDFDAMQQTG